MSEKRGTAHHIATHGSYIIGTDETAIDYDCGTWSCEGSVVTGFLGNLEAKQ